MAERYNAFENGGNLEKLVAGQLPDGHGVSDPNTELLTGILSQLKIMNLHLSMLTDNSFFKGDSE